MHFDTLVTMLRKNGTLPISSRQWIGHSSLKTTDRYSHMDQELEYRRNAVGWISLLDPISLVGPNDARTTT